MSEVRSRRPALLALCIGLVASASPWLGCRDADEPPPGTVRVAAIQYISAWAQPRRNRQGMKSLVREAAERGARIVVLPETAIPGYMSQDIRQTWQAEGRSVSAGLRGRSPKRVAETVPGESTRELGRLAKDLGIYLTVPILEVDRETGSYYNTLVLLGPDGEILLHYRKLNPWRWAEMGWASKGDRGLPFVDTEFGRLGLLICFDINFEPPNLARNRIDHLLYAIAWVDKPGSTWFTHQLPAIARKADMNIIGANWSLPPPDASGTEAQKPRWAGFGKSLVIARNGKVLARVESDFGNAIVLADLPIPAQTP